MNIIILSNVISSDRMTTTTAANLIDAKNLYEDFIKYANENDLMKDETNVHEAFLEYYENCIHNTDKHKTLFKHFFPKTKKYNPLLLSVHLCKQTISYIYEYNGIKINDE